MRRESCVRGAHAIARVASARRHSCACAVPLPSTQRGHTWQAGASASLCPSALRTLTQRACETRAVLNARGMRARA
eukprot:341707-Pleurochrysis_carterae.AAC.1